MSTRQKRSCPLCEKVIWDLGMHLKMKHKMLDRKERAPLLKQSLKALKLTSVKSEQVVPKMKEERKKSEDEDLRDHFLYLEDSIVDIQLRAMNLTRSADIQSVRDEVRALLLPIYSMVRTSVCKIVSRPSKTQQQESIEEAERKNSSDVQWSAGGYDFLKEGELIRCQECHFVWDGCAQHRCPYDDEEKTMMGQE